jgi:hypothetical protein
VEAGRHRPLWQLYTADAQANDQRFAAAIRAVLPVGGLVVCDLGCFSLPWCDDRTDQAKSLVTRLREKTASRTVPVRSQGRA